MLDKKKGQVTIFVILAIVIVVAGISIFIFRDSIFVEKMPASFEPIETTFLECVETNVQLGATILETKGGYISDPEFFAGTRYMPFSSKLSFAGTEIPYWFYVSGSGIAKTQIPTVEDMQKDLQTFLENKIDNCFANLEPYQDQGFSISLGEPSVEVRIDSDFIDVNLDMPLAIVQEQNSYIVRNHDLRVDTKLGYLYKEAVKIYEKEQEELFLENYSLDVLRLYAPVDGVELTCSPLVWSAQKIYQDLKEALEVNTMALKNQGENNDYFVVDLPKDYDANFLYFQNWPTYIEINPTKGDVLRADPVGNQIGMGILGFCYVPYHFVYNLRHPVLVQVSKDEETFQFPLVVLIEGNNPRESLEGEAIGFDRIDLCSQSNTEMNISVYDNNLDPIDANISYDCLGSSCELGETENAEFSGLFPQCGNGILRVSAPGFKETELQVSTVDSGEILVILDKEFSREVKLNFDGKNYEGMAVINFEGDDFSKTLMFPENNEISLSPGNYDLQVYVYSNSTLKLPASEQEQCVDVPRAGVLGMVGLTKKECTTVEFPEQVLTSALIGGGKAEASLSEVDLINSKVIEISGQSLNVPKSLEELQENYLMVENRELEVNLI